MPRIEIGKIPAQQIASYPTEFAAVISGREKQRIGDAAGLTQFGVNVTRIKAGSASALRHWHEQEDEHVRVVRLHQLLKPFTQVGGLIAPLSVVACQRRQRYQHEEDD